MALMTLIFGIDLNRKQKFCGNEISVWSKRIDRKFPLVPVMEAYDGMAKVAIK